MINEDKWESWTNEKMSFFINNLVRPPYKKDQKVKKCQTFNFDECSKKYFGTSLSTSRI